ncbi:MAG: Gfo/Idh/MocA family oxidoreductase, partial [Candidatus Marinimicrobia bacterium]|nr:Gfo/Idh/MocA family oxidoreductase [Candidatus Neomarinimicrobiota bacterium]
MKQIFQSFKTGLTNLEELPVPNVGSGSVLIETSHSLVSLGTERMLIEFGKANLISKAGQQPEKVNQVLDKIRADGFLPTLEAVFNKLGQPIPLGYCNVGKVIAVGNGVSEFTVGDRVASNGSHAEVVSVPKNLVAKLPDSVSDEDATFTVIGSIGLQGIRLLKPQFGETIVVFGLGLIGLITCQLLIANGCSVIGIDLDQTKCDLAEKWGIETINPQKNNPVKSVMALTHEIGADGVLITASTKSNDVISQAAQMSRKRGRIILVGVVGLDIDRADFYEKELTFQVSCSYGPGRYDDQYEQKGIDYPLSYVRWTEKRNFEAILNSINSGNLNVKDLITERVPLEDYNQIYENIDSGNSIASLLIYPGLSNHELKIKTITLKDSSFSSQKGIVGIIGAGNFTNMTVLPCLKGSGAKLKMIASSGGASGTQLAKKHGISQSTTDYKEILNDNDIDTVIITTRHGSHSKLVLESFKAGKNTFVEKPLALNQDELNQIIEAFNSKQPNAKSQELTANHPTLTVGFNRRFSRHLIKVKQSMGDSAGPVNIIANMNAGFIPLNHWVHDMEQGGGRIIGEACHLMDVCVYLSGSLIKSVCMNSLGNSPSIDTDNASILLKFHNGSNAVINYFSNGSKKYSKERVEVYSQERTWIVDNYKKTEAFGVKGFKTIKTKLDKGHKNQFHELIRRTQNGGKPLIPIDEIINVTKASFAA